MIDRAEPPIAPPYRSTLDRLDGHWRLQVRAHDSDRCDHVITVMFFPNGEGKHTAFISWPTSVMLSLGGSEEFADALRYATIVARRMEHEVI